MVTTAENYECQVWPCLKGLSWGSSGQRWIIICPGSAGFAHVLGCRSRTRRKSKNCGLLGGGMLRRKIQLPLHGADWCQSQCTWGSILKWKRLSLVSWLCWGSLCALSKMSAQQENVVGMGMWLMASLPYQQWSISDRRQFHVGNAAVAVGDTALNEE